jgi:PTH1 family peptidyl-tRNA hydrolase
MNENIYLIAGLGNPGREHLHNRHNIGFLTVDRIAVGLSAGFMKLQNKALITRAEYDGRKIILAKPQTYMNDSGRAISSLIRFYKVELGNVMIIHDHLDLPLGNLRLRPDGGSGGQQGMNSIIHHLGTQEFPRLRFGIGRPPGRMDPAAFVLQDFSDIEMEVISEAMALAHKAIACWLLEGLDAAMNQYNSQSNNY